MKTVESIEKRREEIIEEIKKALTRTASLCKLNVFA
jgi:hypothetical protein